MGVGGQYKELQSRKDREEGSVKTTFLLNTPQKQEPKGGFCIFELDELFLMLFLDLLQDKPKRAGFVISGQDLMRPA